MVVEGESSPIYYSLDQTNQHVTTNIVLPLASAASINFISFHIMISMYSLSSSMSSHITRFGIV